MNSFDIEPWDVLESATAFSNRWLRVRRDVCRTNRGSVIDYYVVERASYVAVVALTARRDVLLVRQYKHGAGRLVLELPAGFIEGDEDPLDCARRELLEETGYEAENWESLAVLLASPSTSTHCAHLFLATGAHRVGDQRPDQNEKIAVEALPFEGALQAVGRGGVQDLTSTAALALAFQRLKLIDSVARMECGER